MRRWLRSPVRRDVPDSVVSPESGRASTGSMVDGVSHITDDAELRDMLMDLEDLIAKGKSDEEIAREYDKFTPAEVAALRPQLAFLRSV
jgi:hypothetical protein